MLKIDYISTDLDVQEWAAPEPLKLAAKQLIDEQRRRKSSEKLREGSQFRVA